VRRSDARLPTTSSPHLPLPERERARVQMRIKSATIITRLRSVSAVIHAPAFLHGPWPVALCPVPSIPLTALEHMFYTTIKRHSGEVSGPAQQ
jgi:hypothetical protein